MKVNPDKFQFIVFGKQDNLGSFNIGGHYILVISLAILIHVSLLQ